MKRLFVLVWNPEARSQAIEQKAELKAALTRRCSPHQVIEADVQGDLERALEGSAQIEEVVLLCEDWDDTDLQIPEELGALKILFNFIHGVDGALGTIDREAMLFLDGEQSPRPSATVPMHEEGD